MWDEAAWYFWYLDRFKGWTTEDVDATPHWLLARLPGVAAVFDEAKAEQQKAAMK